MKSNMVYVIADLKNGIIYKVFDDKNEASRYCLKTLETEDYMNDVVIIPQTVTKSKKHEHKLLDNALSQKTAKKTKSSQNTLLLQRGL
jgi:hypothetical protein